MKSTILLIIFLFNISFAGTEIQNGGGGLLVNGNVATFGSVNLEIEEISLFKMPILFELIYEINNMRLSSHIRKELVSIVNPSQTRKYFNVSSQNIDSDLINKLKKDYIKALNLENDNITIFAITNINSNTTILLPDFYKLSILEKKVILFHESMWLSGRIKSISEMVNLEMKFQRYLSEKNNEAIFEFYFSVGKIFNEDFNGLLYSMIELDLNNKLKSGTIEPVGLTELFSSDTLAALSHYIRRNIFKDKNNLPDELIYTLQSEIENKDDPYLNTKIALLQILLTEDYYSNFREIIELDVEISNKLKFGDMEVDTVDQLILNLLDSAEIKLSSKKIESQLELCLYNSQGEKIGKLLPIPFYK